MNVLFVHGFGGARGPVERALAETAYGGCHHLVSVHWPSGDLREMRARAVVEVARKVAEKKSLPRGLMEAAMQGTRQASQAWEQAVANVPAGAAQLDRAIEGAHATGKPTSILAFSLGCRVVLYAIEAGVIMPGSIERIVFAGSAAPPSAFQTLAAILASGTKVVHVFSKKDAILDRLYPFGEGKIRPSGRAALETADVENVQVDVGHRGYASIAPALWALATGEADSAAISRLPSR
jgi:pimeloyl-ACP methyl ester carboxylesterase